MEISDAHHQAMANHQVMEEMLGCPKSQQQQEKRLRPHPEQALKCPRCESTNTKFCYYNNYSLSQPRYFCKGCRRYWTKGGSLRNVPVGGGCRKNKRSNSSTSSSSSKKAQDQDVTTNSNPLLPALPLPPLSYDPSDLTLAFASLQNQPPMDDHDTFLLGTPNSNPNPNSVPTAPTATGFLDILRSGFADTTNTPTGFQSCHYYGFGGNGSVEEVGGGVGGEGMMMFPFDGGLLGNEAVTVTTSQGSCKAMDGGENSKVVMGLQWPLGGDANLAMDSGRDYWNGVGSSNWHGLINSSLM